MKKHVFGCNACGAKLEANLKVCVTAAPTEDGALISSGTVESDPFKCKRCGVMLSLTLAVQITQVVAVGAIEGVKTGTKYTNQQQALLTRWQSLGLLAVFEDAIAQEFGARARPRVESFLFTFLSKAQPIWPKREVIRAATGTADAKRVNCWEYGGVTGLVINGYIRAFVPTKLLSGKVALTLNHIAGAASRHDIQRRQYLERRVGSEEGWIKTRFGYVVGRGELFDEVRAHTYHRNTHIWPPESPESASSR